jgi:hypothetical protein
MFSMEYPLSLDQNIYLWVSKTNNSLYLKFHHSKLGELTFLKRKDDEIPFFRLCYIWLCGIFIITCALGSLSAAKADFTITDSRIFSLVYLVWCRSFLFYLPFFVRRRKMFDFSLRSPVAKLCWPPRAEITGFSSILLSLSFSESK